MRPVIEKEELPKETKKKRARLSASPLPRNISKDWKRQEIQKRYNKKGLKLPLIMKVMRITSDAWRREVKRLATQMLPSEEKQREMVERYARLEAIKDRVIKRVKEFLFPKKGLKYVWFEAYIRATKDFFGRLRRTKGRRHAVVGRLSAEKIKEWEEKKIKEGCAREILREIMKIVSEEFGKI